MVGSAWRIRRLAMLAVVAAVVALGAAPVAAQTSPPDSTGGSTATPSPGDPCVWTDDTVDPSGTDPSGGGGGDPGTGEPGSTAVAEPGDGATIDDATTETTVVEPDTTLVGPDPAECVPPTYWCYPVDDVPPEPDGTTVSTDAVEPDQPTDTVVVEPQPAAEDPVTDSTTLDTEPVATTEVTEPVDTTTDATEPVDTTTDRTEPEGTVPTDDTTCVMAYADTGGTGGPEAAGADDQSASGPAPSTTDSLPVTGAPVLALALSGAAAAAAGLVARRGAARR